MFRTLSVAALTGLLLIGLAAPARADITAFLGETTTPTSRKTSGFAIGVNLIVIGFEFEYSNAAEDDTQAAPGLKTGMGNIVVGTPTLGTQLYATVGGGIFNESFLTRSTTNFGYNVGGGAKIHLAGPFRLRLDYRRFILNGDPLYKNSSRFYAGINFSF